ncbi:MAG: excinuclease ABC subunit UvrA [Planctomycetes bacterium]|nr:excinuclease ABC subunit UvrA [Planctomycetota bacterium]
MSPADPNVIRINGARVHNLRDVTLTLPKGWLICFTGVSGSGKSSLAFDTLYAEGQRRYIESLSSYARQFMGELPKPDVDQITGLAPSISIQQKTSGWNPRSTVGTITQVHDYLRVLFARVGTAHCPKCGRPITAQTREHMLARILALDEGTRAVLLAPKIRGQKGEYRDLFAELSRQGFVRARVDGEIIELASPPELDRYRRHDIEVVVDRLVVRPGVRPRLAEALELALSVGDGTAIVMVVGSEESSEPARGRKRRVAGRTNQDILLSSGFACTACGLSFEPPNPQMFSFNSPQGMCEHCDGLGMRFDFDPELLIPDPSLSFLAPCVAALRRPPGRWRRHIYEGVARHLGVDLRTPWRDLPRHARDALLYGTRDAHITFEWRGRHGVWKHGGTYEGIVSELHARHRKTSSMMVRRYYEQFMRQATCPSCRGARLNAQALAVRLTSRRSEVGGGGTTRLNIDEACRLPIDRALVFFDELELEGVGRQIAEEPLKEIRARLRFLMDVGLEYLTLDRAAPTLAGGESQRIRLASQIGCGLVGVLYVLDEPSIGLHPRDNRRLLASLQRLRDMGNTVIVVEHDRDTMEAADRIVDFGPGPGVRGGEIVAQGTLREVAEAPDSLTGAYLSGRQAIETPAARRPVTRRSRRTRPTRVKSSRQTGE